MQNNESIVFRVDETSDLPIWAQLRNRMAYLIKSGQLAPGEQLPSVRSLSADAKINYNTVTRAYRDLELSGLIVSVRGRGMFVQKNAAVDGSGAEAIDALLEDCIEQYKTKGLTYEEIKTRTMGIIDALRTQAEKAGQEKDVYRNDE